VTDIVKSIPNGIDLAQDFQFRLSVPEYVKAIRRHRETRWRDSLALVRQADIRTMSERAIGTRA
jgi:hypothetical protein